MAKCRLRRSVHAEEFQRRCCYCLPHVGVGSAVLGSLLPECKPRQLSGRIDTLMYRARSRRIRLNTLHVNTLQESHKGCTLILR